MALGVLTRQRRATQGLGTVLHCYAIFYWLHVVAVWQLADETARPSLDSSRRREEAGGAGAAVTARSSGAPGYPM